MRAVLDVNVLISALLSSSGAPAAIVRAWLDGRFELIASPLLLEELGRALGYPKLRRRIPAEEAQTFIDWLARTAVVAKDPTTRPAIRSTDPNDDYLLALAAAENALLASGDDHLLSLASAPVYSPAEFLALLQERGRAGQP